MVEAANIIKRFIDLLQGKGLTVSRIILFGSYSYGSNNNESDVDIAIISPDFKDKDPFSRARMIREARVTITSEYQVPLDIILLTEEELTRSSFLMGPSIQSGISFSLNPS